MSCTPYATGSLPRLFANIRGQATTISNSYPGVSEISAQFIDVLERLNTDIFPLFSEGSKPGLATLLWHRQKFITLGDSVSRLSASLESIYNNSAGLSPEVERGLFELYGCCFNMIHALSQHMDDMLSFLDPAAISNILSLIPGARASILAGLPRFSYRVQINDSTIDVNLRTIFEGIAGFLAVTIYHEAFNSSCKNRSNIYKAARDKLITDISTKTSAHTTKWTQLKQELNPVAVAGVQAESPVVAVPVPAVAPPSTQDEIDACRADISKLTALLAESAALNTDLNTYATLKTLGAILTPEEVAPYPDNGLVEQALPDVIPGYLIHRDEAELTHAIQLIRNIHMEGVESLRTAENQQLLTRFLGGKKDVFIKLVQEELGDLNLTGVLEGQLKGLIDSMARPEKLHAAVKESIREKQTEIDAAK